MFQILESIALALSVVVSVVSGNVPSLPTERLTAEVENSGYENTVPATSDVFSGFLGLGALSIPSFSGVAGFGPTVTGFESFSPDFSLPDNIFSLGGLIQPANTGNPQLPSVPMPSPTPPIQPSVPTDDVSLPQVVIDQYDAILGILDPHVNDVAVNTIARSVAVIQAIVDQMLADPSLGSFAERSVVAHLQAFVNYRSISVQHMRNAAVYTHNAIQSNLVALRADALAAAARARGDTATANQQTQAARSARATAASSFAKAEKSMTDAHAANNLSGSKGASAVIAARSVTGNQQLVDYASRAYRIASLWTSALVSYEVGVKALKQGDIPTAVNAFNEGKNSEAAISDLNDPEFNPNLASFTTTTGIIPASYNPSDIGGNGSTQGPGGVGGTPPDGSTGNPTGAGVGPGLGGAGVGIGLGGGGTPTSGGVGTGVGNNGQPSSGPATPESPYGGIAVDTFSPNPNPSFDTPEVDPNPTEVPGVTSPTTPGLSVTVSGTPCNGGCFDPIMGAEPYEAPSITPPAGVVIGVTPGFDEESMYGDEEDSFVGEEVGWNDALVGAITGTPAVVGNIAVTGWNTTVNAVAIGYNVVGSYVSPTVNAVVNFGGAIVNGLGQMIGIGGVNALGEPNPSAGTVGEGSGVGGAGDPGGPSTGGMGGPSDPSGGTQGGATSGGNY